MTNTGYWLCTRKVEDRLYKEVFHEIHNGHQIEWYASWDTDYTNSKFRKLNYTPESVLRFRTYLWALPNKYTVKVTIKPLMKEWLEKYDLI